MDVSGKLRVGEHQRVLRGKVGARDRADQRFYIFRQRRKAVRRESMRIDGDFFIRCVETARLTALTRGGIFLITRLRGNCDASWRRLELRQSYPARRQFMFVGGVDIVLPTIRAEAEPFSKLKNE